MSHLTGKVAFITGGGSGIGRGIAERLARDGADIFIADIDAPGAESTVDLVNQLGRRAVVHKANVAAPAQLEQAAAACVERFGRLDIAVANAGIGRAAPVLDMSLKDWQDQLDVNLTGVFLTVQATARQMVRLGNGGRIVCISSLAAETTGANMWSYSATKAGVRIMVRGWAQELGPAGITVNAIGPGVIDTPLAAGLAGEADGVIRKGLERRTPVGRVGKPSDIAGLVSFMCGPDGEFMSGSYVIMDGGLRDARASGEPEPAVLEEMQRIMVRGQARRSQQQTWIDERD
jgi:NAD(P)-dependent dehydrogenase (short-subunit alcohol dehydrogenase family)